MKHVDVSLDSRSYQIHIGAGVVARLAELLRAKRSKRAFIISDEKLIHARTVLRSSLLQSGWEVHEFPVRAGEEFKDFESIYPLYGKLIAAKANRESHIFALGGGTIGDAVGFIAATYLRGVPWVGVPTTLLAQVDSSVGGKTGINHSSGKNLIGAFYQPELVVCDTDFLRTLSTREIVSGLGEVIKIGITFDPELYATIEKEVHSFLNLDEKILTHSIQKALQWKSQVVSRDELDRKEVREVLNFGHTFGHALESVTRYQVFQHGEAVIWGMRFALALSQICTNLSSKSRLRLDSFLASLPVPAIPKEFNAEDLFAFMKLDKKVRDEKINFVLLKEIGKTVSENKVQKADLAQAYQLLGPAASNFKTREKR